MEDWLSVTEAAERLGVSDRQVRNLLECSQLDAQRIGRTWAVSAESVRARAQEEVSLGRPLSAATAWRLLARVDAALRGELATVVEHGDRRVRHRLRRLQAALPPVELWDQWMRRRADLSRVRFHPGVVPRVLADRRVVRADPSHTLGVRVSDLVPVYVDQADSAGLLSKYRGQPVELGDASAVNVMSVPELPDGIDWRSQVEVASLLDLAGHPYPRVRHAARARLQTASAALRAAVG